MTAAAEFWTIPFPDIEASGENPCILCGREVKGGGLFLHVVHGGSSAVHVEAEPFDDGEADLGYLPVGSNCARRVPAGFVQRLDGGAP